MAFHNRKVELSLAVVSFTVAAALAFTALAISPVHEIEAGVCMTVAQFLMLTASIIGIDYKLGNIPSLGGGHHEKT